MGEFFAGWRRKMAIVTLTSAMAITGLRLRSDGRFDGIYLNGEQTQYSFVSVDSQLRLARITSQQSEPEFIEWAIGENLADIYRDPFARADIEWRCDCLGAMCGACNKQLTDFPTRIEMLAVPHWFSILPLTLLSAYLLLGKPRSAKTNSIVETNPTEVL